ncbi:MAG: hemerythrin domain-containing protein [Tissierellia bacterium]|nr:hemerythrin domain-containing protein [Tissierellia bacterium]MDD4780415.1 hemerythrin domain-containing protein [Tissierellia bacterium]
MNSVEIMVKEHDNILRMLKVVRKACYSVLNGNNINYDDFYSMIDFIKTYADDHHHGKEEKFLFKEMQVHLGRIGENLITHGMLVEHDYGRFYISELKEALRRVKNGDDESKLDVISNAIGYVSLLTRHIAKENTAVYNFGETKLPKEVMDEVNLKSQEFEQLAQEKGTQKYYINLLENLEKKY